jgi:hypothetical protein
MHMVKTMDEFVRSEDPFKNVVESARARANELKNRTLPPKNDDDDDEEPQVIKKIPKPKPVFLVDDLDDFLSSAPTPSSVPKAKLVDFIDENGRRATRQDVREPTPESTNRKYRIESTQRRRSVAEKVSDTQKLFERSNVEEEIIDKYTVKFKDLLSSVPISGSEIKKLEQDLLNEWNVGIREKITDVHTIKSADAKQLLQTIDSTLKEAIQKTTEPFKRHWSRKCIRFITAGAGGNALRTTKCVLSQ